MTNYLDKGRLLLQQKEYTKALEFFQAAIESKESPKDAYLGLAEVYFALQKDKQGREALFYALALDPYNERSLMMAQQHCFAKETFIETKGVPGTDQIAKPSVGASSNVKYTVIPPSVNCTPYFAIEFSDGNLIYLEKQSNGYSIVAPNRKECLRGKLREKHSNNWDGYKKPIGFLTIPSLVCIDGETLPITKIGDNAFYDCEISKVIIPNTIISIGVDAFAFNEELDEVYIPDSVKTICASAFSDCFSLTKIRLSEELEVIDKDVFYETDISSIDIPASVKKILSNAFDFHNYLPQKMIMHGAPPTIVEEYIGASIRYRDGSEDYVPSAFLQEYKFSKYWQEMKLIPY